jgi:hypothetical protein
MNRSRPSKDAAFQGSQWDSGCGNGAWNPTAAKQKPSTLNLTKAATQELDFSCWDVKMRRY